MTIAVVLSAGSGARYRLVSTDVAVALPRFRTGLKNLCDSAVGVVLSVAVTVNTVAASNVVGVPLIAPVTELKLSPVGNAAPDSGLCHPSPVACGV